MAQVFIPEWMRDKENDERRQPAWIGREVRARHVLQIDVQLQAAVCPLRRPGVGRAEHGCQCARERARAIPGAFKTLRQLVFNYQQTSRVGGKGVKHSSRNSLIDGLYYRRASKSDFDISKLKLSLKFEIADSYTSKLHCGTRHSSSCLPSSRREHYVHTHSVTDTPQTRTTTRPARGRGARRFSFLVVASPNNAASNFAQNVHSAVPRGLGPVQECMLSLAYTHADAHAHAGTHSHAQSGAPTAAITHCALRLRHRLSVDVRLPLASPLHTNMPLPVPCRRGCRRWCAMAVASASGPQSGIRYHIREADGLPAAGYHIKETDGSARDSGWYNVEDTILPGVGAGADASR